MPVRKSGPVLETLSTAIPKAFEQAQSSIANHQKNYVALHKIHVEAAEHTEKVQDGEGLKLIGERKFKECFLDMIDRVLVVKKGTIVADRIVKFVGGYVKFLNKMKREGADDDDEEEEQTVSARFVAQVLKHLLKGFEVKDKNVRYRAVHFVAEMISHMGEIDEGMYSDLRSSLLKRVRDKEPTIRVQAVIALSKINGTEDPDELDEGEQSVSDVLEDMLRHDPSAEVRRAVLLNMAVSDATLPAILSRTRDVDTTIRKLVYSMKLEPNCIAEDGGLGPSHPRALTIDQRELIVKNGLGDREDGVRLATGKLIGKWVDAVGTDKGEVVEDILAFLDVFDIGEGLQVADDALQSVFVTRSELFEKVEFDDTFWTDLSSLKAFLARVYVDHCIETNDEKRRDGALPVVTKVVFCIQQAYNELLEDVDGEEKELAISELLRLAVNLDYGDEIGRRNMSQLVRNMLLQESLPEKLVPRCLDILRILSASERDLIRIVVEIVHDIRDANEEEEPKEPAGKDDADTTIGDASVIAPPRVASGQKPVSEMSQEEKERADALDIRCLDLCIGMLERVNGTFEENSTLEGILTELIVPSVKRKELVLREKGLISLGLCCLIARRMAVGSFPLFAGQIQAAPEQLKVRVLQVVFDVLMVHEAVFRDKSNNIVDLLLKVLNETDAEAVQAALCIGFAKLMLSGMLVDERVLSSLVLIYLAPDTADNQELRQCLSYFFPVYCFSSPVNQRRMQQVFLAIYEQLASEYKTLEDGQDMVSPAQVAGMFVDWTDPQKSIDLPDRTADPLIHLDLAIGIVKMLFSKSLEKDDKKVLCQVLNRLYVPPEVDDDKIRTLKLLILNIRSRRPLRDTAAVNALTKFENTISKKFEEQLRDFNEEEFRKLESLKELFELLDEIIPEDDDDEVEQPKKRATRKRRSESVTTETSTASVDEDRATPTASRRKGKGRAKRRRVSQSDEDEDDEGADVGSPPPSAAPTRSMPRRAATKKVDMTPMKLDDDDEEDEDDDEDDDDEDDEDDDPEATPVPPARRPAASRYA
ncbi:ARM repeat-containing protein [Auriscalpium vulgare]|uniref:ARM repeat-containing protein n=1 Tax=Auriscalpium vulgare TaxID=40419 RepID=A0ACB8R8S4_9AGAM|nr:ARM repeat-containing protein [Auriscalpium vulgare]